MTNRLLMLPVVVALTLFAAGCAGSTTDSATAVGEESDSATGLTTARVEVEMDHCFVVPVWFDGEQWNVPFDRQFGWGGMAPEDWRGTGVMVRVDEDRARFEDDGGSTVVFRLVDDPSVRPVERALCD